MLPNFHQGWVNAAKFFMMIPPGRINTTKIFRVTPEMLKSDHKSENDHSALTTTSLSPTQRYRCHSALDITAPPIGKLCQDSFFQGSLSNSSVSQGSLSLTSLSAFLLPQRSRYHSALAISTLLFPFDVGWVASQHSYTHERDLALPVLLINCPAFIYKRNDKKT